MPNTTPIGADALREALWICVEHNALHFGETHNTVVQGRAALANSAPKAALAAAVADAVAAERERCAQVCDRVALAWDGEEAPDGGCVAKQCSDAIREGQGKG